VFCSQTTICCGVPLCEDCASFDMNGCLHCMDRSEDEQEEIDQTVEKLAKRGLRDPSKCVLDKTAEGHPMLN
jgi:hypothetical protein